MVRGEQLDVLDEKADVLNCSAERFKNSASDLRCEFLKKKIRNILMILFILLVIILIIVWISGGFKSS